MNSPVVASLYLSAAALPRLFLALAGSLGRQLGENASPKRSWVECVCMYFVLVFRLLTPSCSLSSLHQDQVIASLLQC